MDFGKQTLRSTVDPLERNNSSKSMVNAPYNSSLDTFGEELEDQIREEGMEVMLPRDVITLSQKLIIVN